MSLSKSNLLGKSDETQETKTQRRSTRQGFNPKNGEAPRSQEEKEIAVEVDIHFIPGTKKTYSYSDIKVDSNGWANPQIYLPRRYDLAHLLTSNGCFIGWWTGAGWYCRKQKIDSCLGWKRIE